MFLQKTFRCSKDDISRLDAFENRIFHRILRGCMYQGTQAAGVSMLMNDLTSLLSGTSLVSQSPSTYTNLSVLPEGKSPSCSAMLLTTVPGLTIPGSQHCVKRLGLQCFFNHSSSQPGLPWPLPKDVENV